MQTHLPFHVMTKPIGPICNLDCEYCYYLAKEMLYPWGERFRMAEELLEEYVRQYIEAQPGPTVSFAWQGGEPTLMGLPFFRRVVELQARYAPAGKRIENSLQTNGTLLDDDWCAFFREHGFLIGISIDGPRELHDRYRVDKGGRPSFDRVMRGLALLQQHAVEYNVLCVVNRANSQQPLEVYRFFKGAGVRHIQFIPLVEPTGDERVVTARSVEAAAFGEFLVAIFDEWIANDVGTVFIQIVEEALSAWLGVGASLCIFQQRCGRALAMEHNGDVFCCDHFVLPEYRLGNIRELPLAEIVESKKQRQFGDAKLDTLPRYCRECEVRFVCNGECPKNRIIETPDGEPGLNYLCAGYKRFFTHIGPYMRRMAALLRAGLPPAAIVPEVRTQRAARFAAAGRNDPCPCGSGRKYKRCCMGRAGVPA